jgi:biopolymer transport protein ExbB
MIERLTRLMIDSGAGWVLVVLIALSVLCVAIAIERLLAFRRSQTSLDTLVPQFRKLLRAEDLSGAARVLDDSGSVAGRVVAAGLAEVKLGAAAAEEAMAAALGLERKRLEKRLIFLGTVGNNAPFVGLLGTVIGVIGAFDALGKPNVAANGIAAASALAPERVMGSIAEALVATALGLVVAIPAVAVFNYFQTRVAQVLADAETLGHVMLVQLRAAPERTSSSRGRSDERTRDRSVDSAAE